MEQKLPKWFDRYGIVHEKGAVVQNKLTKEEYKLNNIELSMYDLIIGIQTILEAGSLNMLAEQFAKGYSHETNLHKDLPRMNPDEKERVRNDMKRGLAWFRMNNEKAYMGLFEKEEK
tara:strand:- start:568 stop:918 length:351 start_codon:yes stop_codon:yes gene_type:complete